MSELKLTYFDFPGRAEAIRLALTIGDISFEDDRIIPSEFVAMRESLPYKSVPVLEIDGLRFAQSSALLRYCGKRGGLYPLDPLQALKVDEVVDTVVDFVAGLEKIHRRDGADDPKHEKDINDYLDVAVDRYLGGIDRRAAQWNPDSNYIVGEKITIADLAVYLVQLNVTHGIWHHFSPDRLKSLARFRSSAAAVAEHPKVAEWNEDISRRAAEVRRSPDSDQDE